MNGIAKRLVVEDTGVSRKKLKTHPANTRVSVPVFVCTARAACARVTVNRTIGQVTVSGFTPHGASAVRCTVLYMPDVSDE